MSHYWFTSDLHFWHVKGIQYNTRPFKTIVEMNTCLIDNWNSCVKENDKIFIMGDFCLAGVEKTTEIIKQLNGYKVLIMGNHDYMNHKPDKWLKMGVDQVHTHLSWTYGHTDLNLSHFPYKTFELDKREFRDMPSGCQLKDDGKYLLHGHVHRGWKRRNRMINVGVDVRDYYPMSLGDIFSEMHEHKKEEVENGGTKKEISG